MNGQTLRYINNTQATTLFAARQIRQKQNAVHPHPQKFTPASRNARINSWHQRMQGLFARQSY